MHCYSILVVYRCILSLIYIMAWALLLIHSDFESFFEYIYTYIYMHLDLGEYCYWYTALCKKKFAVGNPIIQQLEKWMKKLPMFCPHFCLLNHGLFYKFVIIFNLLIDMILKECYILPWLSWKYYLQIIIKWIGLT